MGLTLIEFAAIAGIGRSTLAALEGGKLGELGYEKVRHVCAAADLLIDIRPPELDSPLMDHRHLTVAAGRDLTKAAIEDVIMRGEYSALRGLVQAIGNDASGRIARRVRKVVVALDPEDSRARAFGTLLPDLLRASISDEARHS